MTWRWVASLAVLLALACTTPSSRQAAAPTADGQPGAASADAPRATTTTGPEAPAATPAREPLTIGFSAASPAHASLYAAYEAGLFVQAGLAVELTNLGAGTPAQAALLSGQVPAAAASGISTVSAVLAGGDLRLTGAVFDAMPYQLVAGGDIPAVTDLRGKLIGINRLGGSPHTVLRYILRGAGVDPENDVHILQVGQQADRLAALRSGAIDATIVDAPFSVIAEREGLRVLADAAELDIPYPHDALVMNGAWLRAHHATARRVLQAIVDGNHAFRTDRELGTRAFRQWLHVEDAALLDDAYTYFRRVLPDVVLPRPEGLQLVLDEAALEQPAARNLRPEDLVDASLARELR